MRVFNDNGKEWDQEFLNSEKYRAFDRACRDLVESFGEGDLRHLDYAMNQCVNENVLMAVIAKRQF